MLPLSHNPDVLTCIANLSNDEVFTPPTIANLMLDQVATAWAVDHNGANIWADPNVKFLDPFTKSGIFLREITQRLSNGLANEIPDLQERINHILTQQVFGIAITDLTALIARRSVYCSKWANSEHSICTAFDASEGNIWFERTEHTWAGGRPEKQAHPTKNDEITVYVNRRCSFCGARESDYNRGDELDTHAYALIHTDNVRERLTRIFGASMQFDVVIGNPPYQLSDGGGTGSSAIPLYHKFVEQAKGLDPRYLAMIIPSRWFTGGKGLDGFREEMLNDPQIRHISDYPDSRDVFDGVDVAGGVCYFLWQKDSSGPCEVVTHVGQNSWPSLRNLREFPVFIRDNRALSIVKKVRGAQLPSFSEIVSPRRPFDIDSSERGETNGDLRLFTAHGDATFSSSRLSEKGSDLIPTWRSLVSKTSSEHAGQTDKNGRKRVLSRLEVMPPGSVCTESYLVLGPFENKKQAEASIAYLKTRFARFMIQSVLHTQNITQKSFSMLPLMDFDQNWSDGDLNSFFGLSKDEIAFIEASIREM
nr:restriction endonuclease [Pseudoglutamicibacter albus]